MQEHILSLVETLDESRKDMLSRLKRLTAIELTFKPTKNTWSPLDIAEHCVKAEGALFANMFTPGTSRHTLPTLFNQINLLWRRFTLRWKVPIPAPVQTLLPQNKLTLEGIAVIWGDHMAWLRAYVEKAKTNSTHHTFYSHYLAGPLTFYQALDIAILHVNYHLPTLAKRINDAKKTKRTNANKQ